MKTSILVTAVAVLSMGLGANAMATPGLRTITVEPIAGPKINIKNVDGVIMVQYKSENGVVAVPVGVRGGEAERLTLEGQLPEASNMKVCYFAYENTRDPLIKLRSQKYTEYKTFQDCDSFGSGGYVSAGTYSSNNGNLPVLIEKLAP